MPTGLAFPHIIDRIGHDAQSGEVALIMIETRPWTGGNAQLFELQEKINAYLSFALDGEMAEAYPGFRDQPVRLQLDTVHPPGERALDMIEAVRGQILFQGIRFEVRAVPELAAAQAAESCGPSCSCAGGGP